MSAAELKKPCKRREWSDLMLVSTLERLLGRANQLRQQDRAPKIVSTQTRRSLERSRESRFLSSSKGAKASYTLELQTSFQFRLLAELRIESTYALALFSYPVQLLLGVALNRSDIGTAC
jgi:hypothetical protein